MKSVLVICCTLLVITGERFVVQMENIGIRKRKIAVQEEAIRILRGENAQRPMAEQAEEKL
jgi:hypothetical protein